MKTTLRHYLLFFGVLGGSMLFVGWLFDGMWAGWAVVVFGAGYLFGDAKIGQ